MCVLIYENINIRTKREQKKGRREETFFLPVKSQLINGEGMIE